MRFSHHDKQHILRLLTQQGQIKRIFDHFTREVGLCLQQWSDDSSSPLSLWKRNPQLERKINELLQQLSNELKANISQNTDEAWNSANLKNDELVDDFVKRLPVSDLVGKGRWQKIQKGMLSRNIDALKAFKERTVNDMTVSQRVWKVAEGAKSQLEHFISSGIASGRSAAEISRDVRHLLNDPDKRFRRVRNKEGKLVLSQPMKNFHPGRGVYRSSYKNALRLAATETNSAYRLADAKRWENMMFITGIEIKRSPANRGPCVICDSMKGEYPKDFVFTGWHPACWCIAVPIMMDDDDFIDLLVDNKTSSPVKQIEDIPEGAKKFINSNEKYLKLMSVQDIKARYLYAREPYAKALQAPSAGHRRCHTPNCQHARKAVEKAETDEQYTAPTKYKKRLLVSTKADKNDLADNLRVAKAIVSSESSTSAKIRPHVRLQGVKNPELEINERIADNKRIQSEKGVKAAYQTAIKQGCKVVVLDMDAVVKKLRTKKLSQYIGYRHSDFENDIIEACYVVYRNRAVRIDKSNYKQVLEVLEAFKKEVE